MRPRRHGPMPRRRGTTARARRDSKNGGSILAFSRDAAGADCDDELQALLDGER
nr:hypothetical protein [Streptomyces sp. WAC04770]